MEHAPLYAARIFEALSQYQVRYLLAGGLAVNVHGFERSTGDMDIIPAPDLANYDNLMLALQALEARVLGVGDFEEREVPLDLTVANLSLLGNWRLLTREGILDLLQHLPPLLEEPGDFDSLESRALPATYGDVVISVVGLDDLLVLKREAGRDRDLMDIRALTEANDDTGRL